MSAQYCGCDPEAQWTCEEHQGVADDVAAWNKWREQGKAAGAVDPHAPAPAAQADYARPKAEDIMHDYQGVRDALLELEQLRQQVATLEKNLADAQSDIAGEIAERERQVATLQGAMAAQDEREQRAGERCGIERGVTGCDWPDAVAEEVLVLRQRYNEAVAALNRANDATTREEQRVEALERQVDTLQKELDLLLRTIAAVHGER